MFDDWWWWRFAGGMLSALIVTCAVGWIWRRMALRVKRRAEAKQVMRHATTGRATWGWADNRRSLHSKGRQTGDK